MLRWIDGTGLPHRVVDQGALQALQRNVQAFQHYLREVPGPVLATTHLFNWNIAGGLKYAGDGG